MNRSTARVNRRTAQKWINWAHELEAESFRLSEAGYSFAASDVNRASRRLGDAGRDALAKAEASR